MQIGQYIREEGPEAHQKKAGTPTMGGVLIVLSTLVPTLLWADLTNGFVLLAMFALLAFAAIGFVDDYAKVSKQQNLGLTSKKKFSLQLLGQLCCAALGCLVLATRAAYSTQLSDSVCEAAASGSGGAFAADVAAFVASGVRAVSDFCGDRDCGRFECGEFDGWARWPGDRLHGDRGGRVDGADVCQQQLSLGDVSRDRSTSRAWRS